MSTKTEQDDRPRKKKKKQKKAGAGLWIGLGIGGGVLLLAVVVGVVLAVWRPWEGGEEKKPLAQNPPLEQQKPGKLGGEVVKEPKSLLGNIRRRVDETKRDAEIKGILELYMAYCDEDKNPNSRSLDGFLKSIKTAPSQTVHQIKNRDYTLNFRARLGTEDVVTYETEPYSDKTYFCIRANNEKGYLTPHDMKAAGVVP